MDTRRQQPLEQNGPENQANLERWAGYGGWVYSPFTGWVPGPGSGYGFGGHGRGYGYGGYGRGYGYGGAYGLGNYPFGGFFGTPYGGFRIRDNEQEQ